MRPLLWLALVAALALAAAALASRSGFDQTRLAIATAGGPVEFQVELAVTPAERSRGLMFRESLADDHGMLFDFGTPQPVTMWMRNTYIPLDMLFVRADGQIGRIIKNAQPLSDKVLDSKEPVRAVLELRGGITTELGIASGDRIVHPLFSPP